MRTRDSLPSDAEIDAYAVEITRQQPRSKELVPLRQFIGHLPPLGNDDEVIVEPLRPAPTPPSQPDPVDLSPILARIESLERRPDQTYQPIPEPAQPPQIDLQAIVAHVATVLDQRMEGRFAALEERLCNLASATPQQPMPVAPQPASDLPAFLQRAAQAAGAAIPAYAGPSIADAIAAVNDIERRAMDAIEGLARKIDDIFNRLDMPPAPVEPADYSDSIKTLTTWLQSIDDRAKHADDLAVQLAEEMAKIGEAPVSPLPTLPDSAPIQAVAMPEVTVDDARAAAVAAVKAAAREARNKVLGSTADERDTTQRLTEIALNARTSNARALDLIARLAGSSATADAIAKALIEKHDHGTDVVVGTLVAETKAVALVSNPGLHDVAGIEAVKAQAIAEIMGVVQ